MNTKVLLIIPCFNEEKRIHIEEFQKANSNIDFLFANDGSSDGTAKLIKNIVDDKRFYLFNSKINHGKANIIHLAFKHASKYLKLDEYSWIGFWDADLATPLFEVENMLKFIHGSRYKTVWGSRVSRLGSKIRRSTLRHYLGRIFATIVSYVLDVKTYDSQCGAKLFNAEYAQIAFSSRFQTNWVFDIEILLKLDSNFICEYPLTAWDDIGDNKVNIKKDFIKVLKDIYTLWKSDRQ